MRYGINLPVSAQSATAETISAAARRAEALGFQSLWVGDHVVIPTEPKSRYPYSPDGRVTWDPQVPWLDPLLALSWAAAATSQIGIGTAVLVAAMRPAVLLAKQLATLDRLSGGRLTLGVGAGWLEEEFELLGQPAKRRWARLEQCVRMMRACWSQEIVRLEGEFRPAAHPFAFQPKPARGAGLPVWIGGASDAALRHVAALGEGWFPIAMTRSVFEERLARLDAALAARGRTRRELKIAVQADGETLSRDQVLQWESLGVTEVFAEISWRNNTVEAALAGMEKIARRLDIGADANR